MSYQTEKIVAKRPFIEAGPEELKNMWMTLAGTNLRILMQNELTPLDKRILSENDEMLSKLQEEAISRN